MKSIKFNNYRCFNNLEINLYQGINVLFGENASGKTSVLEGIKSALSSFFAGYSDDNTKFIGLKKSDFSSQNTSNGTLMNIKPIEVYFDFGKLFQYQELIKTSIFNNESSFLRLSGEKSNDGSRTQTKGIQKIKNYGKILYSNLFSSENYDQLYALPLIASFSTNDIHSSRKLNKKIFKQYDQKTSFGYYECLQGEGFLVLDI